MDFNKELHDKNINFLIGSGASFGALPTLDTEYKKGRSKLSLEELATELENDNKTMHSYLVFCEEYFKKLISPAYTMDYKSNKKVWNNYKEFIKYILNLMSYKKHNDYKRCNIFTTNYDLFLEYASDSIMRQNNNFVFNDGSSGFIKKLLLSSNFSKQVNNIGVFNNFVSEIPIINLIKLHGSISWKKETDDIVVEYDNRPSFEPPGLSKPYLDGITEYKDICSIDIDENDKEELDAFWNNYKQIPIVNPTKWKFHETVFEQHYYQMLRLLSYELEKKDTWLIVFGFSFKDEHIYELVKRSLLNPYLTVCIFCYDNNDLELMKRKFAAYNNVFFIKKVDKKLNTIPLDFSSFLSIIKGLEEADNWKVEK